MIARGTRLIGATRLPGVALILAGRVGTSRRLPIPGPLPRGSGFLVALHLSVAPLRLLAPLARVVPTVLSHPRLESIARVSPARVTAPWLRVASGRGVCTGRVSNVAPALPWVACALTGIIASGVAVGVRVVAPFT